MAWRKSHGLHEQLFRFPLQEASGGYKFTAPDKTNDDPINVINDLVTPGVAEAPFDAGLGAAALEDEDEKKISSD